MGHVVILVAVLVCLRLGWWQWEVSQRPGGTAQNLGYALLWPVFAGCFIYMWLRYLQLAESQQAGESGTEPEARAEAASHTELAESDPVAVAGPRAGADARADVDAHADRDRGRPRGRSGRGTGAAARRSTGHTVDDPAGTGVLAAGPTPARARPTYTVGVGVIGGEEDQADDELAAYNRALAALAEQDDRRVR